MPSGDTGFEKDDYLEIHRTVILRHGWTDAVSTLMHDSHWPEFVYAAMPSPKE